MATEAIADRPVEATATATAATAVTDLSSNPEPTIESSDAPQDAGSDPAVNGAAAPGFGDDIENKHISDIVDVYVNPTDSSISGGSDTEATKYRSGDDDKGHVPTSSSIKKPATFKSVSVNKTFLAAKAAGTPVLPSKLDKTSASAGMASSQTTPTSAAARPRLVAKSGSGLSGTLSRSGLGAGGGRPAAVPDPNAVWNKNRPVPPPDPKKFTDEELKKHGIHMATRLQSDDAAKDKSNWADIDDDDDWIPEEIRWTDGTKSTIPHVDEHPTPTQQAAILAHETSELEKLRAPPQMEMPPPTNAMTSSVAGSLTQALPLKPGSLPSGKGLVLKGVPEKPTLVAKPPAPPTPAKSPWATLPPVDRSTPLVMELPTPQHPSRVPPREFLAPKSNTPPPFKEIAADDFSRTSLRDAPPHSRELYNSHSGRLEPVHDRRAGPRQDAYSRYPPAQVLSRNSEHPEPSAAFQTYRSSGQDGPYGRRRGSSNVSGGSGGLLNRLNRPAESAMQPPDFLGARRGSTTGTSDGPSSPRNLAPMAPHIAVAHQQWQPRVSPRAPYAAVAPGTSPDNRALPNAVMAQQGVDEVELQGKIMRERRELARQRRLEEEAKEEAAKNERIRLKLEALGPAPERRSAKKDATKGDGTTGLVTATDTAANTTTIAPAQPRPSLHSPPTADNEVDAPRPERPAVKLPNGLPKQISSLTQPPPMDARQASRDSQQSQPWQGAASAQQLPSSGAQAPTWGTASQQQQSLRNVWGAPNSNRSLGNGTFDSDLGRVSDAYPPQPNPMQSMPGIGPIGPPSSQRTASASAQAIAPIGPPRAASVEANRSAWASAVKGNDGKMFAERQARREAEQREAQSRGSTQQDQTIRDNWKPTAVNERGERQEDKTRHTIVHSSSPRAVPSDDRGRSGPPAQASTLPPTSSPAQGLRGSRFFPRDIRQEEALTSDYGRPRSPSPPPPDMYGHPAFDGDLHRPHVSLPPPQIVVRLPPKAVGANEPVTSHIGPRWGPAPAFMPTPPSVPAKADPSWQARIDTLLDRKPTSPQKPNAVEPFTIPDSYPRMTPPASFNHDMARNLNTGTDGSTTTKNMVEECFEEQEMGSLPTVRLPSRDLRTIGEKAAPLRSMPRKFTQIEATSIDIVFFARPLYGLPHQVDIRLPGMSSSKTVTLPTSRTRSNPRRSNYRGGARRASGAPRGANNRDASASYSNEHSGSNRRGGYRGRSDNWSRQPATLQT